MPYYIVIDISCFNYFILFVDFQLSILYDFIHNKLRN